VSVEVLRAPWSWPPQYFPTRSVKFWV